MKDRERWPLEKKQEIVNLIGTAPHQIVLLSSDVAENKDGTYRVTSAADKGLDGEEFGYVAGVFPTLATVELANLFPTTPILTTSHSVAKPGVSHAKVYSDALISRGVDKDRIILNSTCATTKEELRVVVETAIEQNWDGPIAIIVNDWHIERTAELFAGLGDFIFPEFASKMKEFTFRNIDVRFVSAEQVLKTLDPKFERGFKKLSEKEPFKSAILTRAFFEQRGINKLKRREY